MDRQSRLVCVTIALLVVGACSRPEPAAVTEADAAPAVTSTAVGNTSEVAQVLPNSVPNEASLPDLPAKLEEGAWLIDLESMSIDFDTLVPLDVEASGSGEILLSLVSSRSGFEGIGVFEFEALAVATAEGAITARLEPSPDLSAWIAANEGLTLVASGADEISGLAATWFRFDADSPCATCFRPLFAAGAGGDAPVYGTPADFTWQIWTVESSGRTFAVTVEGPSDVFDELLDRVQPILTSLELRPDAERSIWHTGEGSAVGRIELELVDTTRRTPALSVDGSSISAEQDSRTLLVSVVYPSSTGGWNAGPADGTFPLVLVAPPLGDFGMLGALEFRLAQAGYVVARVRYPASSHPAQLRSDIFEQPADTTFVLDSLIGEALPPELRNAVDDQNVGIVGMSMGGTTIYGLLASDCCSDPRFDAAIAHAPSSFDFEEGLQFGDTPLLIVTSTYDVFAPPAAVESIRDLNPDAISTVVLNSGGHLDWLKQSSADFETTTGLTLSFLDHFLKGSGAEWVTSGETLDGVWMPAVSRRAATHRERHGRWARQLETETGG